LRVFPGQDENFAECAVFERVGKGSISHYT
jgi:hypothetical protein